MASSRLVLPCPLSPATTLNRGPSTTSAGARLRNPRAVIDSMVSGGISSDAHGHHDREELALPGRPDHRGIELAAQPQLHFLFVQRRENVEEVLRVEADGHVRPVDLDGDLVDPPAALRRLGGDAHGALDELQLHAPGALAGGDRYGAQGLGEGATGNAQDLLALRRDDLRVRRELRIDEPDGEGHAAALEEGAGAALRDLQL